MSCEEISKYLDAYVDGELEAGLMLEVESHIDDCETCAARERLKREFKSQIAALGRRVEAPERLRQRVVSISSRHRKRRLIVLVAAAPLAAAAALLLVLFWGADPQDTDEPLAAVVDDVVRRHARELPMEIEGADPAVAASWFRGKVDFPVRVPNLDLQNASFDGARLSHVRDQQAAQIVYTVDGHRVTLMIFNTDAVTIRGGDLVHVAGRDVVLGRRKGFNVAVMLDGDMAYAFSSDLSRGRLLDIVRSFAR
ncbi:MAG: zf-HC2 domain-containing protein [Deltaproteobacteria bacterium]|nr:zf-HC2 domain-containing protein [Deltaproteobacteria bacterium]